MVLGEIRRLTKFASLYEDDFLKAVIGHSQQSDEADRKLKEKELKALLARDEELDGLFERIYEDNVSGKISDERFSRMSRRYEDEQKELTEKIKQLRAEIEKQSSRTMTTDMFISLVRKYTRAKKLTPRMLNELVEKIEVIAVAVDMLPLPGGMGISETLFLNIFRPVFGSLLLPGMVLSRGLGYYAELLISAAFTVVAQLTIGNEKVREQKKCIKERVEG